MDNHYFLGISVPEEARLSWGAWASKVKNDLPFKQWVHPQDFHITLHFFGRLLPDKVDAVQEKMNRITLLSQPQIRLDGVDFFGPEGRENVLYTKVGAEDGLFTLYTEWKEQLKGMGIKTEQRPYRPHMTLAKKRIKEQIFTWPAVPLPEALFFHASQLHLYRIHPGRSVKYETVHWTELTE
ncbi:RNA 2',3'-cyclic phosphodiesterase [Marinococcus halophilus]|uniref:RNA 2',3'-cyclic phosphodiesterase n=1 Tax=Marinococcus halophilus TaxID=1371 RepID=UPI0009A88989|nr:RNA 2',3'-cyclic phosphodiesterase [Marinococcus halophilus]